MADRFYDRETIQCPFAYYQELRDKDPVHRFDDDDVYLATRYTDCEAVLGDFEVFSNKAGPGLRQRELMSTWKAPADAKYRVVRTLLTNDPPSHTRFRKMVNRAFSPKRIAEMEPMMRAVANELIDGFPAEGTVDYVKDFAEPLPLMVIADFLGVSRADLDIFRRWSDDAAEVLGGTLTEERSEQCHNSLQELLGYFAGLLEERREHPSEDFLGLLLEAGVAEERPLSTEEMLSLAYVTLVAGNETTVNLLSGLMLLLLRNPEQFARVRADRSKVPVAVEEALRLEAPVQGFVRILKQDGEVGGTAIPAGSRLLIVAGAANRDPEMFPDPDRFDVDRANARLHLSFGKGLHYCIGAPLSRLEGVVGLECLVDRLETIELADDVVPTYKDNGILRSLISLPVHIRKKAG